MQQTDHKGSFSPKRAGTPSELLPHLDEADRAVGTLRRASQYPLRQEADLSRRDRSAGPVPAVPRSAWPQLPSPAASTRLKSQERLPHVVLGGSHPKRIMKSPVVAGRRIAAG